jgi:hypothetical protein
LLVVWGFIDSYLAAGAPAGGVQRTAAENHCSFGPALRFPTDATGTAALRLSNHFDG